MSNPGHDQNHLTCASAQAAPQGPVGHRLYAESEDAHGAPGRDAPFGRRNGNYRHGYFTAEAKEQHRIRRFGSFQTTVHSAIPLGELALPSGKLRHPAGRVAHAWRVFLARIPIPSDYQSACQVCWPWQPIALKARRGAICQSLLCFRKRPLILKQLIF
jgi:hypothetical protein